VLPGGKGMPQAAEFLGSSFEHALDRWRAGYQAIVIDSPPALAVADSLIMARHCTGVLVVVNAE
jgi:Mrp family chromosome partitioning ATPase